MNEWPLRWKDGFEGQALDHSRWVGGRLNLSREVAIRVDEGLHIEFVQGREYAAAGIVTRDPLVGAFDARVRFSVDSPQLGTTFELAAIGIDPPRESQFELLPDNAFNRSRTYEAHGAPPYVSAEFDEADGWRIGWNRGPATTTVKPDGSVISDNHYNRYGRNEGPKPNGAAGGWLRLVRSATHWASYRLDEATQQWQLAGEVRHMNLPDPVYLRLAAKHWVKKDLPAAPANGVHFHLFELRGEAAAPSRPATPEPSTTGMAGGPSPVAHPAPAASLARAVPPEVRLVHEVRACRACKVMHEDSPYGPFVTVSEPLASAAGASTAVIEDLARPEPAVLHGCRKAPIMLVGINPNLPGHFVLPRERASAAWRSGSYKLLEAHGSDAEYARHYRYAPPPLLQLPQPEDLEQLLRTDISMLVAPKPGSIRPENKQTGSWREPMQRRARLVLDFDDGTQATHDLHWGPGENLVVLRGRFEVNEVVAGFVDARVRGREARVERANGSGSFYASARRVLGGVARRYAGAQLDFGEDMSLHDAVACASPNWNASGLPLELLGRQCVTNRRWLHQQIAHSAPIVLLVTSQEALRLLADPTLGKLEPGKPPLPETAGGKDGLFAHVARHGMWWTQEVGGDVRSTRVVLAPHFSYPENIASQSYFSQAQWAAFEAAHPACVARLKQPVEGPPARVRPIFGSKDMAVYIDDDEPLWAELNAIDAAGRDALHERWLDPVALLGNAISDELDRRQVRLDDAGHLQRSSGACSYCDNPWWKIGNGCSYGVAPT